MAKLSLGVCLVGNPPRNSVNAVGVVLDYSSSHAYNLVILKSNGRTEWLLFEPQNDTMFKYEERDRKLYSMMEYYLVL